MWWSRAESQMILRVHMRVLYFKCVFNALSNNFVFM